MILVSERTLLVRIYAIYRPKTILDHGNIKSNIKKEIEMTDIFEVLVIGYGLEPIKLFETDDEEKAADCCLKNNDKLLASGVSEEALTLHPQYQHFRRIRKDRLRR